MIAMRALALDYLRDPRSRPWIGMAVLLSGMLISAVLVQHYRGLQSELARLQAVEGLVSAERKPAGAPSARALEEELKHVNAMLYQLTLPWGEIVAAVEGAATRNVALLQMQPEAQQHLLKITAEAKDQDAMLEYVRRLSQARSLTNVHLLSHQVQTQDPQRPVQFSVQATFGSMP
jgi:Tfp pilus assembly protein PilN